MSTPAFRTAVRHDIKPLIGLFGKSGGGKTYTALTMGRGMVGPSGKLGIIDTENQRALAFWDLVPGGFEHLNFEPPFSPDRYAEMLDLAEEAKLDALVIDSMTHEWNGEGGYLDMKEAALSRMAGDDWKKREKCGMAAAAQCKPRHNKFVAKLLRSRLAIILCFRAKDNVKMEKDSNNKTQIVTSEFANPIQDTGLIFEMLISAEVVRVDGNCGCLRIDRNDPNTKWTHPDILGLLPQAGEQVTLDHGAAIARWASGGTAAKAPATKPEAPKMDESAQRVLRMVFDETTSEHGGDNKAFRALLIGNKLIEPAERFNEMTVERLERLLSNVRDLKASKE